MVQMIRSEENSVAQQPEDFGHRNKKAHYKSV